MASITTTNISNAVGQTLNPQQASGQQTPAQQAGSSNQSVLVSQLSAQRASEKLGVDDRLRTSQIPKRTEGSYSAEEQRPDDEKKEIRRKKRDEAKGQGKNLSLTV